MHITRVIPLFLRVLYLTSTWEFSWVEGQRTWTVKVWSFGAGKDLWLFGIYIYIRPRLQHHLHVVPGLFEKTKKKQNNIGKTEETTFQESWEQRGPAKSLKILFSFLFLHFFGLLEFFFGFLLGAFFKVSFFFPVLWGDFSMFFWFYPRGLLQRVIFFCFFVVFFRFF